MIDLITNYLVETFGYRPAVQIKNLYSIFSNTAVGFLLGILYFSTIVPRIRRILEVKDRQFRLNESLSFLAYKRNGKVEALVDPKTKEEVLDLFLAWHLHILYPEKTFFMKDPKRVWWMFVITVGIASILAFIGLLLAIHVIE
ncbi:hypothetical protein [Heliorestis convoluta]|uniref:Uncharacterized protein n=1 Tax=Heliorestis convoluta TaxID=356322 RepID=A0A5Q2MYF1_9FIRM|nr:hypothetical protein [Heliorestis convoluta]QGG47667.1 hypothetical protein FTV88_1567 [Heliorestis convoluta]